MIFKFDYSPNGDTIISTSEDNSLRLWDVATGQCVAVIQDMPCRLVCLNWRTTNNPSQLLAGYDDGSIRMWEVVNEGGHRKLRLRWRSTEGKLNTKGAFIQGARGLSRLNKELLKQLKAVGEPVYRVHEGEKEVQMGTQEEDLLSGTKETGEVMESP
jgi:WD40 repeat protein